MKTKKADTPYCGVRQEVILSAEPTLDWDAVYHFRTFVIDRYKVHQRKDVAKLPAPWTKNRIIREYRFTNVRREHDRQTRYLLKNIVHNPELTLEDKIVNIFLFRAWNKWDVLRDFGFPYSAKKLYNPKLKEKVRPRYERLKAQDPDRVWFTNAYFLSGPKRTWAFTEEKPRKYGTVEDSTYSDWEAEVPLRPFNIGVWLGKRQIVDKLLHAKDQQEAFELIRDVKGFADFLAYQVYVDLTYIRDFPFSENEFTAAGPGCMMGLDYIFKDRDGMNYEECLFWLRDRINNGAEGGGYTLFRNDELDDIEEEKGYPHRVYNPDKLFSDLPEYDRCMNVMSLENCMCELSKYLRVVRGEGRPRNKYKYKEE